MVYIVNQIWLKIVYNILAEVSIYIQRWPWCRYAMAQSKIEKASRGIQGEKLRKDTASMLKLVLTIGAKASPKRGDGTMCPEG